MIQYKIFHHQIKKTQFVLILSEIYLQKLQHFNSFNHYFKIF